MVIKQKITTEHLYKVTGFRKYAYYKAPQNLMNWILTMKKTVVFEAPSTEKCVERVHCLLAWN